VEALRNCPEEEETITRGLGLTAWSGSRAALETLSADPQASPDAKRAASEALRQLKR